MNIVTSSTSKINNSDDQLNLFLLSRTFIKLICINLNNILVIVIIVLFLGQKYIIINIYF